MHVYDKGSSQIIHIIDTSPCDDIFTAGQLGSIPEVSLAMLDVVLSIHQIPVKPSVT